MVDLDFLGLDGDDDPTVVDQVEGHLKYDVFLEVAAERGILSFRRAARWFLERYDWDATEEAVVSALRRYDPKGSLEIEEGHRLLTRAQWSGRTGLTLVVATGASRVGDIIAMAAEKCSGDEEIAIYPGKRGVRILASHDPAAELGEALSPPIETNLRDDMAEVTLEFPEAGPRVAIAEVCLLNMLVHFGVGIEASHTSGALLSVVVSEEDWVETNAAVMFCCNPAGSDGRGQT